jgi:hypothetical protein
MRARVLGAGTNIETPHMNESFNVEDVQDDATLASAPLLPIER